MSEKEMMDKLKRRVITLLQDDGMNVGVCDVAPGFTKNGAICKVTVEVLVPTEGCDVFVDTTAEQMKDMSTEAAVLFVLEELLGHLIQPGSHHARAMAAELHRRRIEPLRQPDDTVAAVLGTTP